MYDKLKEEIPHIVAIVEDVPEPFKEKCFELLLNHMLRSLEEPSEPVPLPSTVREFGAIPEAVPALRISPARAVPGKVRAFLSRHELDEDSIGKLLLIEGDEIHFVREPQAENNAQGQIGWALLLALRNAMLGKNFQVDPEAVRSICIDKGYYDQANFASIFKRNAGFFKGKIVLQGSPQSLSPEGEKELAKLIRSLIP